MTVGERFEGLKKKYYYDEKAAEDKILFIEKHCRHVEGDLYGEPLILPDTFKDEILRPIFGLKRKKGGKRLIRKAYIQMPRKNAKTTMMAAVENGLLFNDGEPSAQIYNCAGDDKQANILYSAAKKMINLDPELRSVCRPYSSKIIYKDSFIEKITSKSDTKHGFNSHGWIYDELHVAKSRDLYDTLNTSTGQRSNPLGIMITTPGTDKMSICYYHYSYSQKLLTGAIEDDTYWCVIYESAIEDDIYSPETWRKANPLYDYSENLRESIESEAKEVENDPANENSFRRLRLGQWTSSETKWIKTELWTSLESHVSIDQYIGASCWLGIDLSATSDLTSLCVMFDDDDAIVPFWYLWIPEKAAKDYEHKFNVPYSRWAKEGKITIVEGNTIDFSLVEEKVLEINENHSIRSVGYDAWNARDLATRLQERHAIEMIINPQGYKLSNALKKIKERIINGGVCHDGNPVVTWTFDNILIKENDQNNIQIVKPKSMGGGSERREKKIDPWISYAMAVNEWMIDLPSKSVYTDRGVITI
jgi:phage terminase large subunit-like protein